MFWLGFYFPELVKVIFLWFKFLSYSGVILAVLNLVFHCLMLALSRVLIHFFLN